MTSNPTSLEHESKPTNHWFIFFACLLLTLYVFTLGIWFLSIFMVFCVLGCLSMNYSLSVRFTIDSAAQVVHVHKKTIFGSTSLDLPFTDIMEVKTQASGFGRRQQKSDMRDLILLTVNGNHTIVYGEQNLSVVEDLASQIRQLTATKEDEEGMVFVPMSEDFIADVEQLCRSQATKAKWSFELDEETIANLKKNLDIPEQRVIFYLNTENLGSGKMGLVVASTGIFWSRHQDDFLYDENRTRQDRMPWSVLANTNIRADKDGDVLIGEGSQIVLRQNIEPEPVIELLMALQHLSQTANKQ